MVDSIIFFLLGVKSIQTKLSQISQLGKYFRQFYDDWHIVLLSNWREEAHCFIREICHIGGGQTLATARVEVPEVTFYHFHTEFKNLGENSIGDHFLFVKDQVERESFEVTKVDGQFMRKSCFRIEGYPLTITEYITHEGLKCLEN